MASWRGMSGLLVAAALVAAGCSGGSSGQTADVVGGYDLGTEAGGQDAMVCEVGGEIVCCPGESNGCSTDGLSVLVCREDQKGWEQVVCMGDDGEPSRCRVSQEVPTGYCAVCETGRRKCDGDDIVLQCNQLGNEWEVYQDCNGAVTGNICLSGGCARLCDVNEKLNIYIGCDFWGVDLDNAFVPGGRSGFLDAAGEQYSVVVSNPHSKYPAEVVITNNEMEVLNDAHDNPFPQTPILPGELRVYNLPRRDADGTVLAPLAYRVQSSIPITAYQFNPLDNEDVFSNDASLLIPSNVLGKYYFVMTREQTFDDLRSFVTVVAVRDDTTVNVDVSAPTLVGTNVRTGETIEHMEPGDSRSFHLMEYDVLNIETDEIGSDMSGTMILANRNVAVFGGSEASNAPNTNHCDKQLKVCEWDGETPCESNSDCTSKFNTCCADHLEQQLFPVKTWGQHYLASKAFPRNLEKDVYRIIAAENNTVVTTLPPQASIPVLNQGEWVDFESIENFEIHATRPIMVGQFLAAQDAPGPNIDGAQEGDAGIGDPAFILLVPNEQFRSDYVFLAPNKYELDYVTVVVPDGTKVWFDCDEIDPELIPESCDPLETDLFERFGTGAYSTTKFKIGDGVHKIYADAPSAVYVYGYDQYVSYGYPAGLNIQDLGLIKEPGEQ